MHGILAKERAAALRDFKQTYSEELIASHDSRSGSVNLTEPVRTLLDKGRQDEALAEVSGLRALDSRFRALNPTLDDNGLEAMLASRSLSRCIRAEGATRSLADGISYDALAKRPNNESVQLTKAVEQCFYDGTGTLGRHGDSDYRNYYGTYPLSVIGASHAFLAEGRQPRPSASTCMSLVWTRSSLSAMASTLAAQRSCLLATSERAGWAGWS